MCASRPFKWINLGTKEGLFRILMPRGNVCNKTYSNWNIFQKHWNWSEYDQCTFNTSAAYEPRCGWPDIWRIISHYLMHTLFCNYSSIYYVLKLSILSVYGVSMGTIQTRISWVYWCTNWWVGVFSILRF